MKRASLCIILIFMLLISGCSHKEVKKDNYFFYGENDDWMAGMIYETKEVFTELEDGTKDYANECRSELTCINRK